MLTVPITNFDEWLDHLAMVYPVGVYGVFFIIVFVETAFFPAAPVLPGDGLLFLVGILAASGSISFWLAALVASIGGFLGNLMAYQIGVWLAPKKGKSIKYLSQKTYHKAQEFYDNYGFKALFYSRFIPLIRSIVPLVAGVAKMNHKTFTKYSLVSVVAWVLLIMTLAFFLGHISWIKHNFTLIILVFTLVSGLPIFILWIKIKLIQLKNKNGNL